MGHLANVRNESDVRIRGRDWRRTQVTPVMCNSPEPPDCGLLTTPTVGVMTQDSLDKLLVTGSSPVAPTHRTRAPRQSRAATLISWG